MNRLFRPIRRRLATAAGVALLLAPGCGDGFPRRYPVSGRVTYQGKPLSKGTVGFLPDDQANGRAANGEIGTDGSFRLTTKDPDDGALPGSYRVVISVVEVDSSKVESVPGTGGIPRHDQLARKVVKKNLIPDRYFDPSQTDLKATVEARRNHLVFDLKD